jgi:hypothetical protein
LEKNSGQFCNNSVTIFYLLLPKFWFTWYETLQCFISPTCLKFLQCLFILITILELHIVAHY